MRRLAVVAALAATGAAACSAAPEPPAPPGSAVPSVGHGSFAYCLGQHGVPAPPGPMATRPAGVDVATWDTALAECSSLAPGPGA